MPSKYKTIAVPFTNTSVTHLSAHQSPTSQGCKLLIWVIAAFLTSCSPCPLLGLGLCQAPSEHAAACPPPLKISWFTSKGKRLFGFSMVILLPSEGVLAQPNIPSLGQSELRGCIFFIFCLLTSDPRYFPWVSGIQSIPSYCKNLLSIKTKSLQIMSGLCFYRIPQFSKMSTPKYLFSPKAGPFQSGGNVKSWWHMF